MNDDAENLSKLGVTAEKIGQVNFNPENVFQLINRMVVYGSAPPAPSPDRDSMDEIILESKLKELDLGVRKSSQKLISQIAEAKKLANEISKTILEKEFLFLLGLISFSLGEYENSVKFHELASELYDLEDSFPKAAVNLCCIGSSFLLQGDIDKALESYKRTVQIIEAQKTEVK